MRPTARALIERIAEALNDTVLPAVAHDKWAASTVRSATTLLNHLASRVEIELPVLAADNTDAAETLRAVRALLDLPSAQAEEMASVLADDAPASAYDLIALEARNRRCQTLIEAILRAIYEPAQQDGSPEAAARALLRDYLARRMARERDLYFPAFVGPPF
jgi:hypothetical protein